VGLANPLSSETSVLRRSLLPGLLASARFNQRRGARAVRLFEIGTAFFGRAEGEAPEEVEMVALAAGGELGTPWERRREIDFFDLKGAVEGLAEAFGMGLEARPAELPGLVPGATAELLIGGEVVGSLGRLAAEEAYPLYLAELALAALGEGGGPLEVELPSRLPGIAVDLTLTHARSVAWAEIAAVVRDLAGTVPDLASFAFKDRYLGEGVPAGAVNTTIAFLYNSPDRSLTQEEVNEHHGKVTARLADRFGWRSAGG
jgi:phenylalanyl-tRNA synthetase beta chain